jgi:hypothetical protein
MEELLTFYAGMHPVGKIALGVLLILLVLAILKRLVKLGILVAILIILIFVARAVVMSLG